jgi:tryptophan-rich sensory protein
MKGLVALTLFVCGVVSGGLAIGYVTAPGEWYDSLAKPAFTPPGWLFAPVWTVLYVLIAIAGWRVWRRDRTSSGMQLWWTQLGLNFLWAPVFFAAHLVGFSLIIIVLLLGVIAAFIVERWRSHDPASAWLFAPYAAWVAFASVLNVFIFALN